ncbi:MAG: CPBP family intramembrane metalloprotease [Lachnospiraceae bacterium]|nr:CPBP family intramembrane metalloprotease [Lachnospiraceae bacterium]
MKKDTSFFGKELKSILGVLMPFVIYYVCYFVASIALTVIVITLLQSVFGVNEVFLTEQEASINGAVGGLAMLIGVIPLLSVLRKELADASKMQVRKVEENCKSENVMKEVSAYIKIPVTILLAVSSALAANILFILLHLTESSETYKEVAANQYGVAFGLGLLLYGVVSPLAEEVVFRGIIFNRMKKEYAVVTAICISSLMFGLYHGNSVQGIYGFIIGCLIAYTYERFGNFFYAVLFHGAANIAVFTITGNAKFYQAIVTPVSYVILTIISVVLVFCIEKMKKSYQKEI